MIQDSLAKQTNYSFYKAMCDKMGRVPVTFYIFEIKHLKRAKTYYEIFKDDEKKINRIST